MPPRGSQKWWDRLRSDAEADHQREGQAFALAPVQGNRHVRRWGLHAGGLVGGQGELYFKSKDIAVGHILPVIELRLAALQEKGLPDDAYLAFPEQKMVQDSLYARWYASEDGKDCLKRVESRGSANEFISRNMKSHWGVEVYKKFGGMPWLHILIAWGSVPAEAVYMYNRRIREKIAQDRQADTVVDDYVTQDHPSERALAYAQGTDPPEPRGIHHRRSELKQLREHAQL